MLDEVTIYQWVPLSPFFFWNVQSVDHSSKLLLSLCSETLHANLFLPNRFRHFPMMSSSSHFNWKFMRLTLFLLEKNLNVCFDSAPICQDFPAHILRSNVPLTNLLMANFDNFLLILETDFSYLSHHKVLCTRLSLPRDDLSLSLRSNSFGPFLFELVSATCYIRWVKLCYTFFFEAYHALSF